MTLTEGKRGLLAAAIAAVMSNGSGVARAQERIAAPPGPLEEVMVTATRQEASINRVAMSISALSQDNLTNQNIRVGEDLPARIGGRASRSEVSVAARWVRKPPVSTWTIRRCSGA